MTNDLLAKITTHHTQRLRLLEQIAGAARAAVPFLKDHQLTNTADIFERLLFEMDASEQELHRMVEQNPQGFMDALIDSIKRDR